MIVTEIGTETGTEREIGQTGTGIRSVGTERGTPVTTGGVTETMAGTGIEIETRRDVPGAGENWVKEIHPITDCYLKQYKCGCWPVT